MTGNGKRVFNGERLGERRHGWCFRRQFAEGGPPAPRHRATTRSSRTGNLGSREGGEKVKPPSERDERLLKLARVLAAAYEVSDRFWLLRILICPVCAMLDSGCWCFWVCRYRCKYTELPCISGCAANCAPAMPLQQGIVDLGVDPKDLAKSAPPLPAQPVVLVLPVQDDDVAGDCQFSGSRGLMAEKPPSNRPTSLQPPPQQQDYHHHRQQVPEGQVASRHDELTGVTVTEYGNMRRREAAAATPSLQIEGGGGRLVPLSSTEVQSTRGGSIPAVGGSLAAAAEGGASSSSPIDEESSAVSGTLATKAVLLDLGVGGGPAVVAPVVSQDDQQQQQQVPAAMSSPPTAAVPRPPISAAAEAVAGVRGLVELDAAGLGMEAGARAGAGVGAGTRVQPGALSGLDDVRPVGEGTGVEAGALSGPDAGLPSGLDTVRPSEPEISMFQDASDEESAWLHRTACDGGSSSEGESWGVVSDEADDMGFPTPPRQQLQREQPGSRSSRGAFPPGQKQTQQQQQQQQQLRAQAGSSSSRGGSPPEQPSPRGNTSLAGIVVPGASPSGGTVAKAGDEQQRHDTVAVTAGRATSRRRGAASSTVAGVGSGQPDAGPGHLSSDGQLDGDRHNAVSVPPGTAAAAADETAAPNGGGNEKRLPRLGGDEMEGGTGDDPYDSSGSWGIESEEVSAFPSRH